MSKPSTDSTDAPITLSLSRLQALLALAAPFVAVVLAWASLQGSVARAQETADRAEAAALRAEAALQTINVRLERIQTVVERLDRQR